MEEQIYYSRSPDDLMPEDYHLVAIESGSLKRPLHIRLLETLRYFGYLGLTAFGGPAAHIAMFQQLFVDQLGWLDHKTFSEIFAIGKALPGPASTQMAFIIAIHRNGLGCGLFAFMLWSLPGLITMTALACSSLFYSHELQGWALALRDGMNAVAIGLVGSAGLKLAQKLIVSRLDIFICWFAICVGLVGEHHQWVSPVAILAGGFINLMAKRWLWKSSYVNIQVASDDNISSLEGDTDEEPKFETTPTAPVLSSIKTSVISLSLFVVGLIVAAIYLNVAETDGNSGKQAAKVISSFYVAGSIIVGGGAVLVPSLQSYVVTPGWMTINDFLFGISIINVLPGPNFNFAAYCGGVSLHHLLMNGRKDTQAVFVTILGCLLGYFGIFFPGLSVKVGIIPLWKYVRTSQLFKTILDGVSSAAVGLVFCAVLLLWFEAFASITTVHVLSIYAAITVSSFVGACFLDVHPVILVALGSCASVLYSFVN